MRKAKTFAVRIVKPSDQPAVPKQHFSIKQTALSFLERSLHFLAGSSIGLAAGVIIYLMLHIIGIDLGNLESTLLISGPAILGIITSLILF